MHEKRPIRSHNSQGEPVSWTMLHVNSLSEAPSGFPIVEGYYSVGKNMNGEIVELRKLGSDNIDEFMDMYLKKDSAVQSRFNIIHPPQEQV
jgi:hypothetical protein